MNAVGFTLLFSLAVFFKHAYGEPVLLAGNGNKIFVRKMLSNEVVKTFTIKEYDSYGNLCVASFYEEDILFYSTDNKIYKIVLLDDNGQQKVSKNGQLFTDPLADHMETHLYEKKYVSAIVVDKVRRKLIFSDLYGIFEINFDGTGFRKIVSGNSGGALQVYGKELYFSDQSTTNWRSGYGIYRVTLGSQNQTISCKVKGKFCQEIIPEGKVRIYSMMIEKNFKKLFFRRGSSVIGVVDINLSYSSYPVKNPRIVISDSQYVDGKGGIAVDGNRLVWNRKLSSDGQLLLGLMNKQMNFVSKKNIYVYGKPSYDFAPNQLDVFQHTFPTNPPTPQPTKGKCTCPCACPRSDQFLGKP